MDNAVAKATAAAALGVDTTASKNSVTAATATASEAKKAAEEKETTIKVSKTTVKKGKYTFTVTAPKNGQYKAVSKTITIKVK